MSEIQVNTINEYTGANGVTIDGVTLKDSKIGGTITIPGSTGTMALTSDISAGMTKLADTDFSGASDATFDNVFSSTYRNYKTLISIKPANNNVDLYIRFRDGSGDISSSNYGNKALYALNSNTNNFNNGYNRIAGAEGIILAGAAQNVAYHGYMDILEPNIAERTGVVGAQTGTGHMLINTVSFNLTTQLTGIKFYAASGNITGSIQIYGYDT